MRTPRSFTPMVIALAFALGCGTSDPDPEPGADASPDLGQLDAGPDAADASPDADADADADADEGEGEDCADELPSIVSLELTPDDPAPGGEVVARVVTRCFTPPITRVEVFTRDPRVELTASADPTDGAEFALTIVAAALDALEPGTYEVGVSVTSSAETLTQERLATLEVSP